MIKREPEVRYDLVVFDLDVLSDRDVEISAVAVLQELTDLGATLGLVSRLPEAGAGAMLGRAQQFFDELECGDTPRGTAAKVRRIIHRLEFTSDRALLVTASVADSATVGEFGASSALLDSDLRRNAASASRPAHVIAELADVVDVVCGRPTLRLVR